MRPRFTPGATALLLLGVVGGLTISASRLLGQTNDSGAFAYIRAIHQQQQTPPASGLPNGPATAAQVLRGRYLVTTSACASCQSHDVVDPNDPKWLAGYLTTQRDQPFQIGPFKTYAKN